MIKLRKKQIAIRRPLTIIIFALILGGLVKLAEKSTLLHSNKILISVTGTAIFIISIIVTFFISEKYIKKYIKK